MGIYRLLLAGLVMASHAGVECGAYDPGVIAVVSFFLLSGYVMTGLIDTHYADLRRYGPYVLDRALRLFPQLLFYTLATWAAVAMGLQHTWLDAPPSTPNVLLQLTILPLNFAPMMDGVLVPQAWSLGLEGFFYLLFPFLLLSGRRAAFAAASLFVFALAYAGRLPQEWFGYRLLPGVLFVFLLGSFLRRPDPRLGFAPLAAAFALAVLAWAASPWVWERHVRILEVLAGLVLGLPIVAALARARLAGPLDALAGDLSYGVFLNHNLVLPFVASLVPGLPFAGRFALALPPALALAYLSFRLIEQPTLRWRRRLRAPAEPCGVAVTA